jgi:hypothetical protein
MLLQPFGGIHLLPGKATAPRPTIAATVPAAPAIPFDRPAVRLVAPPRPAPIAADAAEPPVATSGSLPSGAGLEQQLAVKSATTIVDDKPLASPVPALAAPAPQQPGLVRVVPPAAKSEREAVSAAVATALTGPATLPPERPSPALGPPPPPREPLPMKTDLINPPSPAATPEGGVKSGDKPEAADQHG